MGSRGEIYIACQALKEAGEGDIRALLPGRLWVLGVVDLKPQEGLGSGQQGTCIHRPTSSLKVCQPLLDKREVWFCFFLFENPVAPYLMFGQRLLSVNPKASQ